MSKNKEDPRTFNDAIPVISSNESLALNVSVLLPGDVLLYRPRSPNYIQRKISSATGSPYTHAAIFIGNSQIAESVVPNGVTENAVEASLEGCECVGVLRSQIGFGMDRPEKLRKFVDDVITQNKSYDLIGVFNFQKNSKIYFDSQLQFIIDNYGKVTTPDEFSKQSFFCSAFVVACYSVVGVIGHSAQAAYHPKFFSPAGLYREPTFGWLLGYLIPDGGSIPNDDPILSESTLWRDCPSAVWWWQVRDPGELGGPTRPST